MALQCHSQIRQGIYLYEKVCAEEPLILAVYQPHVRHFMYVNFLRVDSLGESVANILVYHKGKYIIIKNEYQYYRLRFEDDRMAIWI